MIALTSLIIAIITRSSLSYMTQYVHIVVIDGARYSETFGDAKHQYIPIIWNKLRQQGTFYTNYYNDSITETVPGHSTIISGVYHVLPNDGTLRLNTPTLFEYFRKEKKAPISETYTILGKTKLDALAFSSSPEYGEHYGASVIYSESPLDDKFTLNNFKSVLTKYHPRITITNLGQVDGCGHSGIWDDYLHAICNADTIINDMWELIQKDPIYKNKTTLIVTNDHGRHTNDFSSHGDGCDGCRHIMLMMLGPDTKANVIDLIRCSQNDVAPTVGELLDISTPYCTGKSIIPVMISAIPTLIAPSNDTANQALNLSLSWSPVPRSVNYHIQVSINPSFDNFVLDDSLVKQTSLNIQMLNKQTTYFWRVCSKNSSGPSNWSEIRNFSTIANGPPQKFSIDYYLNCSSAIPVIIKYVLPSASEVNIKLFSIDGTIIKTLYKGMQGPDHHVLTIHYQSISAGKYLLNFSAGQFKSTRKFTMY